MNSAALVALLSLSALDLEDVQEQLDGARLVVRGRVAGDGTFEVFEVLKGDAPKRMAAATVPLPVGVDLLLIDDTPYRVVSTPTGDAILMDPSGEDPEFISPKDKRPRVDPEPLALAEVKRMLHTADHSPVPIKPAIVPIITRPPSPEPATAAPVQPRTAEPVQVGFDIWPWIAAGLLAATAIGLLAWARRRR
jgi:hypothetical protein